MTNVLDFTIKTEIGDRNPLVDPKKGDVWEYSSQEIAMPSDKRDMTADALNTKRIMVMDIENGDIVFHHKDFSSSRNKGMFQALLVTTNSSFIGNLNLS